MNSKGGAQLSQEPSISAETTRQFGRLDVAVGAPPGTDWRDQRIVLDAIAPAVQRLNVPQEVAENIARNLSQAFVQNDSQRFGTAISIFELGDQSSEPVVLFHLQRAAIDFAEGREGEARLHTWIASGMNVEALDAATRGWSDQQRFDFANFFMEMTDVDYLQQASYDEILRTVFQVFNQYLQARHIDMEMADVITAVFALATAINAEIKMVDLEAKQNLWNAGNLQEIFAAATFLNFAEREAADNFLSGPPQPMALASPAEQYAAMLDAYFEEIKEMGWRRTKEEKDAESHAKEMEHLSSEAEEIKQKFVAELKAMGDTEGLASLADGYEGDGMSAAEWRSFWTPERAEAFRRAIRNA